MKRKYKNLIILILIALGIFIFSKYQMQTYGSSWWIDIYKVGDTYQTGVKSDWTTNHVFTIRSVDNNYACQGSLGCPINVGNWSCKIVGDLKEEHDVFVGRYEFQGKVINYNGIIACAPLYSFWWESKTSKIKGTYVFRTWYGWIEVNCDAGTFRASDGRSGPYNCDRDLRFRAIYNFNVIFYPFYSNYSKPKTCEDFGYLSRPPVCALNQEPEIIIVDGLTCYKRECKLISPIPTTTTTIPIISTTCLLYTSPSPRD